MKSTAALTVAVVAACLGSAKATACRDYEDTLPDGSYGFCAGVVDYSYFVSNATTSQLELERQAAASVAGENEFTETLLLLLPDSCGQALKRAACLATFPKCATVDPYFLNSCPGSCSPVGGGQTVCAPLSSPPVPCAIEPGKIVGTDSPWQEEMCAPKGLVWDATSTSCLQPLPQMPCIENCVAVSSFDKSLDPSGTQFLAAACPLVSGKFFGQLFQLANASTSPLHPKVIDTVNNELALQACSPSDIQADPARLEECSTMSFTANLLVLSGLAPACDKTEVLESGLVLEIFPDLSQTALGGLLGANVGVLNVARSNTEACGPAGKEASVPCASVVAVASCNDKPLGAVPPAQRLLAALPADAVCAEVVGDETNGSPALEAALAMQAAAFELSEQQQGECVAANQNANKRLYFVPPQPGLPPLVGRLDPAGRERAPDAALAQACPAAFATNLTTQFANLESGQLCEAGGSNARACVEREAASLVSSLPRTAPYRCRAALQEALCASLHMKPEPKTLCLAPGATPGSVLCETANLTKAVSENTLGLSFVLPRFPARSMCSKVLAECADFFKVDSPAVAQLKAAFDCDAKVNVNTCSGDVGEAWGCSSSLNGLSLFPAAEEGQVFGSLSALPAVEQYATALNIENAVAASLRSAVVEPTISAPLYGDASSEDLKALQGDFCQCPDPLVVPDDAGASTLPGSCCQVPCIGSMYTADDFATLNIVQLVLSAMSVALALYMVVTWGVLRIKKSQYFTFWISVCSLQISLAALIMALAGDHEAKYCRDNSVPVDASQGFSLCVLQSVWTIYFALALCGWWMCMSVDLYRKVVWGVRSTDKSKPRYHAFCWIMPCVSLVALIAGDWLGYTAPNLYCVIKTDAEPWVEWAFFYGIIGVMYMVGFGAMVHVIVALWRHTRRMTAKTSSGSNAGLTKFTKMYRTPLLFVLLFSSVWLNIFGFRAVVLIRQDEYIEQATSWVECLLTSFEMGVANPATNASAITGGLIGPEDTDVVGCGMVQRGGIPDVSFYATYILVFGQSILVWLIFGTTGETLKHWAAFFGLRPETSNTYSRSGSGSKLARSGPASTMRSGHEVGFSASPASLNSANASFSKAYRDVRVSDDTEEFDVSLPKSVPPAPPSI